MDGWSDFNALPVWAGMLGLLVTLVRLLLRECIVRRSIDVKTPFENEDRAFGYVAPTPNRGNPRVPEWHYDLDSSLHQPTSLLRWLSRIIVFFFSGRKRAPEPDAQLQSLNETINRQTEQQMEDSHQILMHAATR